MSSGYQLTPAADQDIMEIWQYTYKNWGLERANRYLDEIEKCLNQLVDKPSMGRKRDEIRQGYRSFPINHHLVFYRLRQTQYIEVVRVLHQRMDYENHLSI